MKFLTILVLVTCLHGQRLLFTAGCTNCTPSLSYGSHFHGTPMNQLVGYWPFDEGGTATIAKDKIYNNNASWNGTQSGTYYTTGKVGPYAGSFDGSTRYLITSAISAYAFSGDFTISLWVLGSSVTVNARLVSNRGAAEYGFEMYANTTTQVDFGTNTASGGASYNAALGTQFDGTWHHIVAERQGGTIVYYQDGSFNSSASGIYAGLCPSTQGIYISQHPTLGAFYFSGYIDDLRVYNRALTANEARTLYLATGPQNKY